MSASSKVNGENEFFLSGEYGALRTQGKEIGKAIGQESTFAQACEKAQEIARLMFNILKQQYAFALSTDPSSCKLLCKEMREECHDRRNLPISSCLSQFEIFEMDGNLEKLVGDGEWEGIKKNVSILEGIFFGDESTEGSLNKLHAEIKKLEKRIV